MDPVNYKGRFVYLQLKTFPQKYFQVQLTLAINKTGPALRMSIGNMHRRHQVQGNQVNVSVGDWASDRWGNLVIDIWHILGSLGVLAKDHGQYSLKGLSVQSSLLVRGVFLSEKVLSYDQLPKEMQFRNHQNYEVLYQIVPITSEP